MTTIPVLSCDSCGACCTAMVMPPFIAYFDTEEGAGLLYDEEWETLRSERPDLANEILEEYDRKRDERDWPDEATCFWFDATNRRCKHYEHRPTICREFEVGGQSCLEWREKAGVQTCPSS